MMTDEEWLAIYLLQFGTATITNVDIQQGEAEWLDEFGKKLKEAGDPRGAWFVIHSTYKTHIHKQEKR